MTFTLSSIQEDTYSFFNPFPSAISGTVHTNLIWRKLIFIENFASESIGSDAIPDKYYQPLYDMTVASVLGNLQATDSSDASTVKLGDFSFSDSTGGGTDTDKAQKFFEQQGIKGLENIRFMNYDAMVYKAT